jgi:hypothetical protein
VINGGDAWRVLRFMTIPASKLPLIIIVGYLLIVVICIFCAADNFDLAGANDFDWTLALIGLTLPWSQLSIIFARPLSRGARFEFFAFLYLAFASLNSYIFHRLYSSFRTKSKEP